MPKIIRDRQLVDDNWQIQRDAEAEPLTPSETQPVLIQVDEWQGAPYTAPWLASHTELNEQLADRLKSATLIAIDFPDFNDGRGYTLCRQLRERYQFKGEIRAIGDVLQDQLYYMSRVGFTSFAIREDKDPEEALQGLNTFSVRYQAAQDEATPLFRKRWEAST
ncbi:hypothetical protein BFW38_07410 [Terasakiispira papahanaumokuakeensis]|uniref:Oxidoreductase n=1 Tax=Terasakiispira papahanaumokuakeensis TaxID=197479 RepID=A0A1E2V970_9GAMM|nr:DUF934 domain-containing protein [Terasakiispira papahanaumokuakeensis]ODC03402.1 hypothetical protein BFW38_07410 [Terasakiispira papahanaumokuakeensis]